MEEDPEIKITCSPLPKCEDCGFQNTDNCNTCPKIMSEGLDNFED